MACTEKVTGCGRIADHALAPDDTAGEVCADRVNRPWRRPSSALLGCRNAALALIAPTWGPEDLRSRLGVSGGGQYDARQIARRHGPVPTRTAPCRRPPECVAMISAWRRGHDTNRRKRMTVGRAAAVAMAVTAAYQGLPSDAVAQPAKTQKIQPFRLALRRRDGRRAAVRACPFGCGDLAASQGQPRRRRRYKDASLTRPALCGCEGLAAAPLRPNAPLRDTFRPFRRNSHASRRAPETAVRLRAAIT